MMKMLLYSGSIALIMIGLVSCSKTTSIPSKYVFSGDPYNCSNTVYYGSYVAGTIMNNTNYLTTEVNVITRGDYSITSPYLNGISIASSGSFSTIGTQSIVLPLIGTPTTGGTTALSLNGDNYTTCNLNVPIALQPGKFILYTYGSGFCDTSRARLKAQPLSGVYIIGTAFDNTNLLRLPVAVSQTGSYSLSGSVGSLYFSGNGTFTHLGDTVITLTGSGTPLTASTLLFGFSSTSNSCIAQVPIATQPAVYTPTCASAVANGTYLTSSALNSTNYISMPVTVSSAGSYSLATSTTNGMNFSASGQLTTGSNTIILYGSGQPSYATTSTFNIITNAATCVVNITAR